MSKGSEILTDENVSINENVISALPKGSELLSASTHGASSWTTTYRLEVELPNNSRAQFFLKCALGEAGRIMMQGEFRSMSELFRTTPDFVPKPYAYGKFRNEGAETYFFLQDFIAMSSQLPDPNQLCLKLAKLHRDSISPTGLFGFHITTCQGKTPQNVAWNSSWTTFFRKLLQHVIDLDFAANKYWEELDILEKRLIEAVVPQLLGHLEKDGRKVKPCLIHADLWEGNMGTSIEDGEIRIFDAAAFYAHNEMELGHWRCHYNRTHDKVYRETYLRFYPPSEPVKEWDDRNRLYSVYFNVIYSVNHKKQGMAVRQR